MAIYESYKRDKTGDNLQAAGKITSSVGTGLMGVGAAMSATGVGAIAGVPLMIAGGITSLVGTAGGVIGSNLSAKEDLASQELQMANERKFQGYQAMEQSKQNIYGADINVSAQRGINTSLERIHSYLQPPSGGTGLVDQRLV